MYTCSARFRFCSAIVLLLYLCPTSSDTTPQGIKKAWMNEVRVIHEYHS